MLGLDSDSELTCTEILKLNMATYVLQCAWVNDNKNINIVEDNGF